MGLLRMIKYGQAYGNQIMSIEPALNAVFPHKVFKYVRELIPWYLWCPFLGLSYVGNLNDYKLQMASANLWRRCAEGCRSSTIHMARIAEIWGKGVSRDDETSDKHGATKWRSSSCSNNPHLSPNLNWHPQLPKLIVRMRDCKDTKGTMKSIFCIRPS